MKMGPARQFEGTLEDESKCQGEDQQVPGKWWSDLHSAGLWFKAGLEGTGIEPRKQELVRGRLS